jgi:hypothetical protein
MLLRMVERQPEDSHIATFCYGLFVICAKCEAKRLFCNSRGTYTLFPDGGAKFKPVKNPCEICEVDFLGFFLPGNQFAYGVKAVYTH